jgi:hypothetical protein
MWISGVTAAFSVGDRGVSGALSTDAYAKVSIQIGGGQNNVCNE